MSSDLTLANTSRVEDVEVDQLVVRSDGDDAHPGVRIGASCGVVEWQVGQNAESLLALADQAMFAQKARRKTSQQAGKQ